MKQRSDSYLNSLTAQQRAQLVSLLSQRPRLSLEQVREQAPVWGSGPRKGSKPSEMTFSRIIAELRVRDVSQIVKTEAMFMEAARTKLRNGPWLTSPEKQALFDDVMFLISQEHIQKALEREFSGNSVSAARLLLKLAGQRRPDQRLNRLEKQHAEVQKLLGSDNLTAEEMQRGLRQVFSAI